jgi:GMP synthase (glutamine-hydrolysing)
MQSVLVLQHVPHETLGTLEHHFAEVGLSCRHLPLFETVPDRLELEQAAGLVVLGGPMNVDEVDRYPFLGAEIGWIRQALDARLPLLGICLGSQLLAKALGAKVYANRVKEIGWYDLELTPQAADDPLFAGCAPQQLVFQWHGDTFDLPSGAVHLARSANCSHQAFRYGSSAWGLQFHVEMTPEMAIRWLEDPQNRQELASLDYIDPGTIYDRLAEALAVMETFSQVVLRRFATICRNRETTIAEMP